MSVVNVIDMTVVFDRGVAAVRGVPVTVVGMGLEIAHKIGIWLTDSLVDPVQERNDVYSIFQIDFILIVLEKRIKCKGREIRCWRFCLSWRSCCPG
jgi:hypothetical protein